MTNNTDETTLKAWMVFCGEPYDGCLLVFAPNRNDARKIGYKKGPYDWEDYIDVRARRAQKHDADAVGDAPYIIETNNELPEGAESFYQDDWI